VFPLIFLEKSKNSCRKNRSFFSFLDRFGGAWRKQSLLLWGLILPCGNNCRWGFKALP
jgi:hypothetical protein